MRDFWAFCRYNWQLTFVYAFIFLGACVWVLIHV